MAQFIDLTVTQFFLLYGISTFFVAISFKISFSSVVFSGILSGVLGDTVCAVVLSVADSVLVFLVVGSVIAFVALSLAVDSVLVELFLAVDSVVSVLVDNLDEFCVSADSVVCDVFSSALPTTLPSECTLHLILSESGFKYLQSSVSPRASIFADNWEYTCSSHNCAGQNSVASWLEAVHTDTFM